MKKTMKRTFLLVLALVVIGISATTAMAATMTLRVGDTWSLLFSDTPYVSSDPSVAQVRSDGGVQYTVVAVAPGTATISGGTWMGQPQEEYVITVTGDNVQPKPTAPDAGQLMPSMPKLPVGDPSDLIDDVYKQQQQNLLNQDDDFGKTFDAMQIFFYVMLGLVITILILAVIMEIRAHIFSKKTFAKKVLPPLRTGTRTVVSRAGVYRVCPKCGEPFGESAFCGRCGTAKQAKNTYVFPISKKMYATDFENMANEWFAENPYVYNCKLHVTTDWTTIAFDPTHKFYITKAYVEFNVADRPLQNRYGVAFIYKKRYFRSGNGETLVNQWLENNGDSKAISWENSRISHWDNNALTYSLHYNIVLFQKDARLQ